jgi:TolA-binding protein
MFAKDVRESYGGQLYNGACDSMRNGKHLRAIELFSRFMKTFPDDKLLENALYLSGESCFALGRYDAAIGYFNKTLANDDSGRDEDALIKKGCSFFMQKRYEAAADIFSKYIMGYPNGRHLSVAKKWRSFSSKELIYRTRNAENDFLDEDADESSGAIKPPLPSPKARESNMKTGSDAQLENVAEI